MAAANCPICFSDFSLDADKFSIFPCGHGFCKLCINRLFTPARAGRKCPQCRTTVHKRDAHPIHLELVDSHTFLRTSLTEELESMGPNTSWQTVKETNDKLDKILQESRVEGEHMVSLLKAVEEFKERILPIFIQADAQKKQLERMSEDMRNLQHEKDRLLEQMRRIGEQQQASSNRYFESTPPAHQGSSQAFSTIPEDRINADFARIPIEQLRTEAHALGLCYKDPTAFSLNDKVRILDFRGMKNGPQMAHLSNMQRSKRNAASLDDDTVSHPTSSTLERKRIRRATLDHLPYPQHQTVQRRHTAPLIALPLGISSATHMRHHIPSEEDHDLRRLRTPSDPQVERAGPSSQASRGPQVPADIFPLTLPPIRYQESQTRPAELPRMAPPQLLNRIPNSSIQMRPFRPTPLAPLRSASQNAPVFREETLQSSTTSQPSLGFGSWSFSGSPMHPSMASRAPDQPSTSSATSSQTQITPVMTGSMPGQGGPSQLPLPPAQLNQHHRPHVVNSMPLLSMPTPNANVGPSDLTMFEAEFMGIDQFDDLAPRSDGDMFDFNRWFSQEDEGSSINM